MHTDGAVEYRTARRGAFHRARQPSEERTLCAFTAGTDDEQHCENTECLGRCFHVARHLTGEKPLPACAAKPQVPEYRGEDDLQIGDAIGRKDLQRIAQGLFAVLKVSDQQHGTEANELPTTEKQVER